MRYGVQMYGVNPLFLKDKPEKAVFRISIEYCFVKIVYIHIKFSPIHKSGQDLFLFSGYLTFLT